MRSWYAYFERCCVIISKTFPITIVHFTIEHGAVLWNLGLIALAPPPILSPISIGLHNAFPHHNQCVFFLLSFILHTRWILLMGNHTHHFNGELNTSWTNFPTMPGILNQLDIDIGILFIPTSWIRLSCLQNTGFYSSYLPCLPTMDHTNHCQQQHQRITDLDWICIHTCC